MLQSRLLTPAILPVFFGHLPLLTSRNFLTLILFLVLGDSMQLFQLFRTPFLTQFVHLMHLTFFGSTLKHTFPSSFQYTI